MLRYTSCIVKIRLVVLLAFVSIVTCSIIVVAGNKHIDSLEQLLKTNISDSEKADIFNELAREYNFIDPQLSIQKAKQAYFFSERCGYIKGKADALLNLGEATATLGDFETAIQYFQASQVNYRLINDQSGTGKALSSMARVKNWQGKFDETITLSFMAIRFFQKSEDYHGIAKTYNTIGIAYDLNNKTEKAKQYYYKAFNLFYNINDSLGMANALNNIAIVYGKEGDLEKSLEFFTQSLEINRNLRNNRLLTPILNNIGIIHKTNNNYSEALKCFEEALAINLEINNTRGLLFSYLNLSSLYLEIGQYQKSLSYVELATQIAISMNARNELVDCYDTFSKIYEKMGNYQLSLEYFKKFKEASDTVSNEKVLQNMQLTEEKFMLENQEKVLELQKKDNEILKLKLEKSGYYRNFILGVLISVFAILIMFMVQYRTKKKSNVFLEKLNNELYDANNRLLESGVKLQELNATKDKFFSIISHDLRNPFAALVSFVRIMTRDYDSMSKQDVKALISDMKMTTEKAQTLLENLLLWSKTQSGKIEFNPKICNLSDIVEENIQLFQSTMLQKLIVVKNTISNPTFVFADVNMLDSVIRNLLSNAIKFSEENGVISIMHEETMLYDSISITDKGVGMSADETSRLFILGSHFSKTGTNEEKGSGIGLLITKEFIDTHNGSIQVRSEKGEGTTFVFTIPKKSEKV